MNGFASIVDAYRKVASVNEAVRSVYDNPNIVLRNDPHELKNELAYRLNEISETRPDILKYAEMLFRWLATDIKRVEMMAESDVSEMKRNIDFLRRIYSENLDNLIDEILQYTKDVKKISDSNLKKDDLFIDVTPLGSDVKRVIGYDKLMMTRDRMNGLALIQYVRRNASRLSKTVSVELDDNDKNNIHLTNGDGSVMVWSTTGFDSTNRFIFQLWGEKNMNVEYGNPKINSPYCTRMRGHWDNYASDNGKEKYPFSTYTQYWFLSVPENIRQMWNGSSPRGNLNDEKVFETFSMMKGLGSSILICMNDSFGDILDRYDEKPTLKEGAVDETKITNSEEYKELHNRISELWETRRSIESKYQKQWENLSSTLHELIADVNSLPDAEVEELDSILYSKTKIGQNELHNYANTINKEEIRYFQEDVMLEAEKSLKCDSMSQKPSQDKENAGFEVIDTFLDFLGREDLKPMIRMMYERKNEYRSYALTASYNAEMVSNKLSYVRRNVIKKITAELADSLDILKMYNFPS